MMPDEKTHRRVLRELFEARARKARVEKFLREAARILAEWPVPAPLSAASASPAIGSVEGAAGGAAVSDPFPQECCDARRATVEGFEALVASHGLSLPPGYERRLCNQPAPAPSQDSLAVAFARRRAAVAAARAEAERAREIERGRIDARTCDGTTVRDRLAKLGIQNPDLAAVIRRDPPPAPEAPRPAMNGAPPLGSTWWP